MLRNLLFVISVTFLCSALLTSCVSSSGSPWKTSSTTRHAPSPSHAPQNTQDAALITPDQAPVAIKSKVAMLLPLSGRGSDTGEAMLNAALLAMNDLGATDLFELMPKDTGEGAALAAQEALHEGAGLILGPVFSDDTKAVAPLAVQRGVGVVSFSTDTTAAVGTTFLMGFVPQTQVEQIIDFAATRQIRSIALIAPRNAYGDAVAASFYSQMQLRSLQNAGLVRYSGQVPDTAELASLNQSRPQAILIATPAPIAAKISAQITAMGMPPTLVKRLGTGLWDDTASYQYSELQGAWYAASSPDLRVRFERRYREMYGTQPPRLASLAYDATALAVVLSKSGKGYGRQALTNPNGFAGIDGIFRFRMDGLADRGLGILEISSGRAVQIQNAPSSFAQQKR
ncbi:MAG TPA: penicillin-binding protein activator [Alphaproteobacteria bacterium]|nr:penicillin-binding protein activator [Alphaproteobacteria bacterium]HOO50480.1 penicillin-binding protein activator [Alphaproteobacteria bacterium]